MKKYLIPILAFFIPAVIFAGVTNISWTRNSGTTSEYPNYINDLVGIGTSTPLTKLDVGGDITDENLLSQPCVGTNANGKFITGTCSGSGGTISTSTPLVSGQVDFSTSASTIGNDSQFYWDNTNHELGVGGTPGSAKLYVNGNVGIGTTNPDQILNVQGNLSITGSNNKLIVESSAGSNTNFANLWVGSTLALFQYPQGLKFGIQAASSQGDDGGSQYSMMSFGSTRNTMFGDMASGQADPGVRVNIQGSGNSDIFNVASSSGTSYLRVTSAGNVGIGTTSPDSKLDVNGSVRLEGTSSFVTSAIGGAIVSGGCDSVTTTGLDATISSTTAFVTTPQGDPGSTLGGTWAYSFVSTPGSVITRVCSNVTVTPNSVPYVVKILK